MTCIREEEDKALNNLSGFSLDHLSVSSRHTRASNENKCHCQFVLMSLNIHFFFGPLPIGTPSHWLFVSCSRLSPSTGLCRTRHPPTNVDYHDTPVTDGLHPLLDIAPKNWRTQCSCSRVMHWKAKVSLTDVWQQLFEQQDITVICTIHFHSWLHENHTRALAPWIHELKLTRSNTFIRNQWGTSMIETWSAISAASLLKRLISGEIVLMRVSKSKANTEHLL